MKNNINLKKSEKKIKKKLSKTNHREPFYNGWKVIGKLEAGYHSFDIYNLNIIGHRNNKLRVEEFRKWLSFENKNILDFGCSVGGTLFHIDELNRGIGIDFDKLSIKNANYILKLVKKQNKEVAKKYTFFEKDLNKFDEEEINNLIDENIDIIFLLSLGSWIENWKDLYSYSLKKAKKLVLEINNIEEGEEQIEFFEKSNCKLKRIIDSSIDDNTGNTKRQTFIVTTP